MLNAHDRRYGQPAALTVLASTQSLTSVYVEA